VLAASRGPGSFCVNVTNAACAAAAATRGPTIAARNATYKEMTACQGHSKTMFRRHINQRIFLNV
jgi:hypothetical protein